MIHKFKAQESISFKFYAFPDTRAKVWALFLMTGFIMV
jgi:hypothetical protein